MSNYQHQLLIKNDFLTVRSYSFRILLSLTELIYFSINRLLSIYLIHFVYFLSVVYYLYLTVLSHSNLFRSFQSLLLLTQDDVIPLILISLEVCLCWFSLKEKCEAKIILTHNVGYRFIKDSWSKNDINPTEFTQRNNCKLIMTEKHSIKFLREICIYFVIYKLWILF